MNLQKRMVKVIMNGVRKQVIRRNKKGKFSERSDTPAEF